MKGYFFGFLTGVILTVLASVWFGFGRTQNKVANLSNSTKVTSEPTLSLTPTPSPFDFWQKIVDDSSLSSVAIQTFQKNVLKKQMSGIILSSDGLIVTTADILTGDTVQVFYEDKIIKAYLIKKDMINNLALIKVEGSNFNVSHLDKPANYESGQEYILSGKLIDLSKPVVFSQKALVSYVLENKIVLDSSIKEFLNGAKAFNKDGQMVGLTYLKNGKIYLVNSEIVGDFYKNAIIK